LVAAARQSDVDVVVHNAGGAVIAAMEEMREADVILSFTPMASTNSNLRCLEAAHPFCLGPFPP